METNTDTGQVRCASGSPWPSLKAKPLSTSWAGEVVALILSQILIIIQGKQPDEIHKIDNTLREQRGDDYEDDDAEIGG
jgi:hypothetical protein